MKELATTVKLSNVHGTNAAIIRMTFRAMLRGSILIGLLVGGMFALQSMAMVKTYPDPATRHQFAATLTSSPALGVLYGEPVKVDTPAGYMLFRCMPILGLLSAMWVLFAITKLLRGQEDDGRWEVFLSGQTTARQAAASTIAGGAGALLVAFAVATAIVVPLGSSQDINLSVGQSLATTAGALGPALGCLGMGVFVSQLAATRRRAVLYGVVPLVALFFARSVGNVAHDLAWLKNFTPFGWNDKLHIVTSFDVQWLWPHAALMAVGACFGLYLAGRRDLSESFIAEPDIAKSNYRLLGTPLQFGFRTMRANLVAWLVGALGVAGLMASLSKLAQRAVGDSDQISKALASLSGSQAIDLAFLGTGAFILAAILMAMTTNAVSGIRDAEARGYADNILVGPVSRTRWLTGRLTIATAGAAVICTLSALLTWMIATQQDIHVGLGTLVGGYLSLLGPLLFLLGAGTLLYGLKPRLASWTMYTVILWSFVIDLVSSAVDLNKVVANSSLFHYVAMVPAAQPKWGSCAALAGAGIAMAALGVAMFNRRDLEAA